MCAVRFECTNPVSNRCDDTLISSPLDFDRDSSETVWLRTHVGHESSAYNALTD